MAEYKTRISSKAIGRFLVENISPLLDKKKVNKSALAGSLNMDANNLFNLMRGKPPSDPAVLLRIYSKVSASKADFKALRRIVEISDEELIRLRANNPPQNDRPLSRSGVDRTNGSKRKGAPDVTYNIRGIGRLNYWRPF